MITSISRAELAKMGAGLPSKYLVQQTGYTTGIAAGDGEPLEAILPAGYLTEVEGAKASVEASMKDTDLMRRETQDLTSAQDVKLRAAKIVRRKIAKRGSRMRRMGKSIPDVLTVIGRASTVPAVLEHLNLMAGELEANLEAMGGEQAAPLLEDCRKAYTELASADTEQETALISELPKKVEDFYVLKGTLYVGIKVINDAGQELHSDDTTRAAAYNLRILHRRRGGGGGGGGDGGGGGGGEGS